MNRKAHITQLGRALGFHPTAWDGDTQEWIRFADQPPIATITLGPGSEPDHVTMGDEKYNWLPDWLDELGNMVWDPAKVDAGAALVAHHHLAGWTQQTVFSAEHPATARAWGWKMLGSRESWGAQSSMAGYVTVADWTTPSQVFRGLR